MSSAKSCVRMAALACMAFVCSPTFADWAVSSITYPDADQTYVFGVNAAGDVVGHGKFADGHRRPFIYRSGHFEDLAGPTGVDGYVVYGISDTGRYVGTSWRSSVTDQVEHSGAFVWDGAAFRELSVAGATDVYLSGISPGGRYVFGGWQAKAYDADRQEWVGPVALQGFVFDLERQVYSFAGPADPDSMASLYSVNDQGVAVGQLIEFDESTGTQEIYGLVHDANTGDTRTLTEYFAIDHVDSQGRMSGVLRDGRRTGGVFDGLDQALRDFLLPVSAYPAVVAKRYDQDARDGVWWSNGVSSNGTVVGGWEVMNWRGQVLESISFVARPVPEPAVPGMLLAGLAVVGTVSRRQSTRSARKG